MQYRRFRAPDMQKAIRKIRDAVGPDAVIMSNKRLPSGEVEIVIAIDYDPAEAAASTPPPSSPSRPAPQTEAAPQPSQSYQERIELARNLSNGSQGEAERKKGEAYEVIEEVPARSTHSYKTAEPETPVSNPAKNPYFDTEAPIQEDLSIRAHTDARPSPDEEKLRAMEKELEQVRRMLEETQAEKERVAAAASQKTSQANRAAHSQRLHEQLAVLGLSDRVIEKITADLSLSGREDDWKKALSHLADSIPIRTTNDAFNGCIAFMGPTGVGKTTSIGKIAAQYVLKYGSDSVVLITTDTYRIAAHEQLRTFGRILNVPVEVVSEYSDLNEVLDKYANYSLILVDTAGMNPRDRNLERQLAMMKRARGYLKKLLVLPCTSQRQVLKTVVDVYSQIQLDGCVLSKLDESASLGEAISVVIEEGLPVMYVADGQRIPDDIEPARAHNLISRAVYTAEQFGQLYGSLKYGS